MKYTKLKFSYGKFNSNETDSMKGYIKNKLYSSNGHHMYIDTNNLEKGTQKFKKDLLKYYNNIINNIERI